MNDIMGRCINANQIEGLSTLTGKLCFYEDGFVFKAQGVNAIHNKEKILYVDVERIIPSNTLGFIPNGLIITLKNGTKIHYVVNRRKDVIQFLYGTISKLER